MNIGSIKYAPQWVLNFINANKIENTKAFVLFEMHGIEDEDLYPELRDKTEEMTKAVRGIAESGAIICVETKTGAEWKKYGFDPFGAQYARSYRLILA